MAKILVIDDDPDIRPMMNLMLTRMGHIPTVAARGEEGLAAARSGQFDLVILDLMMPDLDGYEVARRLRADDRTRNLPILIFTARSQPADEAGAFEAGADDYLSKPTDPQELSAKIAELLRPGRVRPKPPESPPPQPSATATVPATQPPPARPGAGQFPSDQPETTLTSRMIVSFGLRGGVGATTLAVNLAGVLARAGRRVCLLDLSPGGGQVAVHLRLKPKATWANLPVVPEPNMIRQVFVRHDSGLFVLAAPPAPVRHGLPGETFKAILKVLDGVFADIVIDAVPILDDSTTLALKAGRHVLAILRPEVGAVQSAISTLRALTDLPVADSHLRLALNQVSPDPGVPQASVEKALGRAVDLVVPYDRAQAAALMQGTPLVFMQPGTPLAATLRAFVARL
jgi:CheY-like chemotaxis protein